MEFAHNHNHVDPHDHLRVEGNHVILAEVPPGALGVVSHNPVETDGGFMKYGSNSTVTIQNLPNLDGMELAVVTHDVRSNRVVADMLDRGYTILSIMAEDNETTIGAETTHQELARFLRYGAAVAEFAADSAQVKDMRDIGTGLSNSAKGLAFEYNGKTYAAERSVSRCTIPQTHDGKGNYLASYTFTDLETGSQLPFDGSTPSLIDRYGLYKDASPQKILSFMAPASDDDPVVRLRRDSQAAATLTSTDQILRMLALEQQGFSITNSPNYLIAPKTFRTLETIIQLQQNYDKAAHSIASRVTSAEAVPAALHDVSLYDLERLALTTNRMPECFQAAVLGTIESIGLEMPSYDAVRDFSRMFDKIVAAAAQSESPAPYVFEITNRIDLASGSIAVIYESLAGTYAGRQGEEDRAAIAATIESAFPNLKAAVVDYYTQNFIDIHPDTPLTNVLAGRGNLESLKTVFENTIEYDEDDIDHDSLRRSVMILQNFVTNPAYELTTQEITDLQAGGVDVGLIPHVISGMQPGAQGALARLNYAVRGSEAQYLRQDIEKARKITEAHNALLSGLSEKVSPEALTMLAQALGDELPEDTKYGRTASAAVQEINRIHAERQSAEPLTLQEAVQIYASTLRPEFKGFLESSYVSSMSVSKGKLTVRLDPLLVDASPVLDPNPSAGRSSRAREFAVDGETYRMEYNSLSTPDNKLRMYVERGTESWEIDITLVS